MEEFVFEKRIYYHDTDCGGVVYYANYLKHFEEARTEVFLEKGIDLRDLADRGIFFVIARVEIAYKAPARYLDTLTILTKIEEATATSLLFSQKTLRDGLPLVEARTTLVCVNNDLKPVRIPAEIRDVLGPSRS